MILELVAVWGSGRDCRFSGDMGMGRKIRFSGGAGRNIFDLLNEWRSTESSLDYHFDLMVG